jgi:hypothetical protein
MSAAKVFIAGSRSLSRLNQNLSRRIDNIMNQGLTVLVGDANGVDKTVQQYLRAKRYAAVIVFCMESGCRNNVGKWATRTIAAADPSRRDSAYYATKDRAMAVEADYGLMLWDAKSRETLTNIVHLVRQGKSVVVYVAPKRSFQVLRHPDQLNEMLRRFDPGVLHRIDLELDSLGTSVGLGCQAEPPPFF